MPATPLPQIQPNLTNLPPGTVLAPAPGTGNVGYAVLPAQYVTQVWAENPVTAFQKAYVCVCVCVCAQLTVGYSMDCSPPGFAVHGILQVRILEWVVISYSRGSSRPRDWTHISCIGRQVLYPCATWEVSLERLIRSKMSSIVTF